MILEKELVSGLLKTAKSRIPDLLLFRREIGIGRMGVSKRLPLRAVGAPGQADLWGVWPGAIHIEIELKSSKGKLSPKQREWKEFCLKNGILHLVLQAIPGEPEPDTIERWCKRIETARPKNGKVVLQIGARLPPPKKEEERTYTRVLPPGWKPGDGFKD